MKNFLVIEGKKFISSREASRITGYSSDYVGQLSRSGKIDARFVGRSWYVGEESLLKYKNLGLEEASKFRPSANREPDFPRFFGKMVLTVFVGLVALGSSAYALSFPFPKILKVADTIKNSLIERLQPEIAYVSKVADGYKMVIGDASVQTASILDSFNKTISSAQLSIRSSLLDFLGIGVPQQPDTQVAIQTATSTTIINRIVKSSNNYSSNGIDKNYVDQNISSVRSEIENLRDFQSRQIDAVYNSAGSATVNAGVGGGGLSDLSSFSTTDLLEGTNFYFSDDRVLSSLLSSTSTTFGGSVTAGAFFGDGSNLTGLSSFSSSTTRGAFSSSAAGLDYSTTTGDFSLASGYEIPLTASTTEWASKVGSQWTTSGSNIYYTTGNVGIGTTTPSAKFSITGSGTGSGAALLVANSSNVPKFTILDNGNAGFGTANPGYVLHTVGANNGAESKVQVFQNIGTGSAADAGTAVSFNLVNSFNLSANFDTNFNGVTKFLATRQSDGSNNFSILNSPGAGGTISNNLTILGSNGNVGIGTTTPGSKLDVWGDLNVGISSTPSLFVNTATGSVGIGTNNPGVNKLSVVGQTLLNGGVFLGGNSLNGVTQLNFNNGTKIVQNDPANFSLGFYTGSPSTENFVIREDGKVGIGTTSPSSKLSVAGDSYFGGNVTATGTITIGAGVLRDWGSGQIGIGGASGNSVYVAAAGLGLTNRLMFGTAFGSYDTSLMRSSSGQLEITNSTTGVWRDLIVRNLSMGTTSTSTTLTVQGEAGKNPFSVASSTGTQLLSVTQAGGLSLGTGTGLQTLSGTASGLAVADYQGNSGSYVAQSFKESHAFSALTYYGLGFGGTSASNQIIGWTGTGTYSAGDARDTGLFRNAAGVVEINSGTAGTWRDLIVRNLSMGTTSTTTATLTLQGQAGKSVFNFASSTGTSLLSMNQSGQLLTGNGSSLILKVNNGTNITFWSDSSVYANYFGNGSACLSTPSTGLATINACAGTTDLRDLGIRNLSMGTSSQSATLTLQGVAGKNPFSIASSTGTNLLTVTQAGNVGIFNSNPANTLVVNSATGNGAVSFGIWPSDSGYGAIRMGSGAISATNYALIGAAGAATTLNSQSLALNFAEAGSVKATLLNGNFGIGSTTPSSKLTVGGNSFLGGNVTATGTLALTGLSLSTTGNFLCIDTTTNQITSGTTCTLSSSRFKQNVQDLNLGLDTVLALRPVAFNFKQGYGDNGSTEQLGFVAEEADAIDPRLVPHDKDGLASGFNYANYTAVLTKAIQEQQLQINALKNATTSPSIVQQTIVATTSTTSVALALQDSSSFITAIAEAVRNLISSAGELIVSTIRSTLAIFDRVETKTAAVSQGLEMKDQATGTIYCVMIKNGDWDKRQGTCDEVASTTSVPVVIPAATTTIVVNPTVIIPNETSTSTTATSTTAVATSTPEIIVTTTPEVATSTPEVIIPPVSEPEVVPEPVTEPVAVSVDNP